MRRARSRTPKERTLRSRSAAGPRPGGPGRASESRSSCKPPWSTFPRGAAGSRPGSAGAEDGPAGPFRRTLDDDAELPDADDPHGRTRRDEAPLRDDVEERLADLHAPGWAQGRERKPDR